MSATASKDGAAAAGPRGAERRRILVVDDERGLRDLLRYELSARGYEVASAADAATALDLLWTGGFDLVISDMRMPGADGLTLLEEVKRRLPSMEFILTTGYGSVETAVEAMKTGAFDFLQKPVDIERLVAVVGRALEAGETKAMLAVHESSLSLFRSVELREVLPVIADAARRLLRADRAVIFLRREDGGLEAAADAGAREGDGGSRLDELLRACSDEPDPSRPSSRLAAPLSAGGKELGFLTAARTAGGPAFSAQDRRYASVFAVQAAQAVRNAAMFAELRAAQDRLIQSEKLGAMGRLSAGIAHEINNPLAAILIGASTVLEGGRLQPQDREDLEGVVEQSLRCRDIVRNLLEFAGNRAPKREELDLVAIAESAARLARCGRPTSAELVRDYAGRPPRVLGDAIQLTQVLVNLLRNALQAVEGRPGAKVILRVLERDGRAVARVEDEGPGIAPDGRARLFEAFYSTKEAGQGTGLGLYLVRLLVERHGGRVSAQDRDGGGAVFTVELPALG
ncbi:MAG: response regulator [Elusimicrobia bacterium]|nr:response regulator [Elusimicrobiota bacterium]